MDLNDKKIRAVFIFEAIGRPPEYLTEALDAITKKIGEEKGVKVLNSKINSPVEMKNQKEFFTNFSEVEVETEQIMTIAVLMFKYMPAHVEIIYPEKIVLSSFEMGDLFSELTRRLHGYEELARLLQNEKTILESKLRELLNNKAEEKPAKEETKKKGSEKIQASSVKDGRKKK
jgi:hypothetical protein